jgi:hypothetical protein
MQIHKLLYADNWVLPAADVPCWLEEASSKSEVTLTKFN